MTIFSSPDELSAAVGSHLGFTEWLEVTQERIDAFAAATNDDQWIHVDPVRAAQGPFGTTIAHGYLTLSLAPFFVRQIFTVNGVRMGVNYGSNKVRFITPVPVGSNLRAGAILASIEQIPGGVQAVLDVTFEVEGASKPACAAQVVSRLYV